jgi:hypothetical protein
MRFRPPNIKEQKEASSDDTVFDLATASADNKEQELRVNIRRHYLRMAGQDGVIKPLSNNESELRAKG